MAATDSTAPQTGAAATTQGISKTTISVAGIALDVFGLSELSPAQNQVSCLWLHHGRKGRRQNLAQFAERVVSAAHQDTKKSSHGSEKRGLIVVAFDQRNHGSRTADPLANGTWRSGNKRHAQDMFSAVTGSVVDTMHLIDVLEGYLWLESDGDDGGAASTGADSAESEKRKKVIDQHLVLGVSMGGHCAWQLLFEDPRVAAGVVVIGCPDYMHLMSARAAKSKLSLDSTSFIGSVHFPPALVAAAKRWDPKGRVFGTGTIPSPSSAPSSTSAKQAEFCALLDSTAIQGKKIQVLSGGKDNLVPYSAAKPFLDWFKDAITGWYKYAGVEVEDNVYPEAGHEFGEDMQKDAVRFVLACMVRAGGSSIVTTGGDASGRKLEKGTIGSPKM